jgi:error-prone DNA polymerase
VVAERFTDLTYKLAHMRDEEGPTGDPPPEIRNRVTGRLIRSRDFH